MLASGHWYFLWYCGRSISVWFLDSAASDKSTRVFGKVGDAFKHCFMSILLEISRKTSNSTIRYLSELLLGFDLKTAIFIALQFGLLCGHSASTDTVALYSQCENIPVAKSLRKPLVRQDKFQC